MEVLDFMAHQHRNYKHYSYDHFSNSTSLKLKTFLHQVVQALNNAKSMVMHLFKARKSSSIFKQRRRRNKSSKQYLHRSSSHIIPIPETPDVEEFFDVSQCLYYDSTWNSVISTEDINGNSELQASDQLRWLEEKTNAAAADDDNDDDDDHEIDRLAEKFIASFHEKFRLEKQESYRRRYFEMLARSV